MDKNQRKHQMMAIHATYRRMWVEGVVANLHTDAHTSAELWASQVLGRLISTLTACADCELNVLRDALNGKPSKVHGRLRDVLSRTKKNPDAWVDWMMHHAPAYKRYAVDGTKYTVETIPWVEAWRLLKTVEPRDPQYRKQDWVPLHGRPH